MALAVPRVPTKIDRSVAVMSGSRMATSCGFARASCRAGGPNPLRQRVWGAAMATHYFPTDRVHFTWDAGNEPVLTVADGDTVVFETRDVSDNQIGPDSDVSVIAGLDWDRVYPL